VNVIVSVFVSLCTLSDGGDNTSAAGRKQRSRAAVWRSLWGFGRVTETGHWFISRTDRDVH